MKRLALSVALAAMLAGSPARGDHCQSWTSRVHVVEVSTAGLGQVDGRATIILPSGYASSASSYPVLLLLHGVGDTFATWVANTDIEELSAAHDVIIVMPDGGHTPDAGWYSDWDDGSRRYETLHLDRLLPYVDHCYRTLGPGHRGAAGLSMGGFGAMSYAGRRPGLFAAAASFSGFLDTMYGWPVQGFGYEAAHDSFGSPNDDVWGDHIEDEEEWRAHNPADLAKALEGTALFLAAGTGTPGGPAGDAFNPGAYAIENYVFQTNVSFVRALTLAEVPFEHDYYVGGYHGWPYWERELIWALPKIVAVIDADPAP